MMTPHLTANNVILITTSVLVSNFSFMLYSLIIIVAA
jgi:hypothetical protein